MIRLVFAIAIVQLRQLIRDRRALAALVALPLMLIAILSFALAGLFGGGSIQAAKIGVWNQDAGAQGAELIGFLKSQTAYVTVGAEPSLQRAQSLVKSGDLDGLLVIPKTYSSDVNAGKTATVELQTTSNDGTAAAVVQSLVHGYGLAQADIRVMTRSSGGGVGSGNGAVDFVQASAQIHPLTAGSYYTIGMMIMFLLSNGLTRAGNMVRERNSDRYKRLLAAPVSRVALTTGQWLATFLILTAQASVLLLAAHYILHAALGPLTQTVLLVLAYAAAIAGLATWIGSFVKSLEVVSGVGGIGANIAAVLGGSIVPIYGFPPLMQFIARILPNGQALQGLVNSLMGISTSQLLLPVCYLLLLGVFLGALGGLRYAAPERKGA